jgi:hypothetical protein
MSESVFPPKDCNSLVVPAMPVWNYEDLILPEVPEAPFVQSTLLDNPAPFPRRQSVNQPDRGGAFGFGKPTAPYSGGGTIELDPCDASGESLGQDAITVQADWTLATGCQIETDQIIPVAKVDDKYYAVGMPKDVVVDIRLVDSASTNTLKVQKKLRTDFGAFHTSVSDWIDATGATTTGPFECPEDA